MVNKKSNHSGPASGSGNRLGFTPEQISAARVATWQAMQLIGLVDESGTPSCPVCKEEAGHGKFKVFPDGGTKHHSRGCSTKAGGAVDILLDNVANLKFTDAVAALTGVELSPAGKLLLNIAAVTNLPSAPIVFKAKLDVEVYNAMRTSRWSSAKAAAEYYAQWHILPEAAIEAGAVLITEPVLLQNALIERFGIERLIACGVASPPDDSSNSRKPYFVINDRYPVIEPHITPGYHTVGMQFRPVGATKAAVEAHKLWKKAYALDPDTKIAKAAYTTPFYSLRGAGSESLLGCGLYRIGKLTEPSQIWVVEGFKDLLAARSMGFEAYAVPGVGSRIPARVMQLFREAGHTLVVCLDGDEAGERGRAAITAALTAEGVSCVAHPGLPGGMDVTDVLVSTWAESGCVCKTCQQWVNTHPKA